MEDSAKLSASLSDEGRYRLLIEAVTDYAIYMLDADGRVSSWNTGARRFKGYAADEIMGQHFSRFYTDEDRATGLPARALATAAREGKFEGEGWRVRKDGGRFWAHVVIDPIRDAAGRVLGFAKITRDLTERRAAEESLRRSQEQFRLLVQSVTDYAIYMLDPAGNVSSWNAGAQRIKQYAPEEIIGQHFSKFYRAEEQARNEAGKALQAAQREGRFESEGWRVRKDGSHFWASVVIDRISNDAGEIIGFAKVTRDITAKRDAHHALEQARESLFQSQKLDAIGQLTGGVSHDFNNLLMIILSNLHLMRRRIGDDPKLTALINNAVSGAERGAALTQRMLSFARRQELKPSVVNVVELVQGMSDLLKRAVGTNISIHMPTAVRVKPVLVDANQLELALLNLVVNARDAMPSGGELTIDLNEEEQTAIDASAVIRSSGLVSDNDLAARSYVCLSVTDTGQGMDEATLARATEPFFTTKDVGSGTGLGLSSVDGLASQSGGRFVLKSQVGMGTRAELWLPIADAQVDSDAFDDTEAKPSPPQRSLTVLAVDDDDLVLSSTAAMLESLGHTVLRASSAQEALEILRHFPAQLLLTDHAMPNMTGTELARRVRALQPDLPVVLATGYAELKTELCEGVVRLTKPFGFDDLEWAIAESTKPMALR